MNAQYAKRDVDTVLGLRIGKGKYNKQRLAMNFESVKSAMERTKKSDYYIDIRFTFLHLQFYIEKRVYSS